MNLQHHSEFKEILDKYVISEPAQQVLKDLKLVLLIAPTSGGRNTIIRHQLSTGKYYYIISDTTRPPRVNDGILEENGKQYWFRSEEDMLADLAAGEYLEAEIIHNQQVSGISIRELKKAQNEHRTAITDVDIEGVPPSFEEWQRRIAGRGRMMPGEEKRRYETALKVFEDGLKHDYYHFVISENIEQSAGIIDAIVDGKSNPHQGRAHSLIQHLEESLRDKLATMF